MSPSPKAPPPPLESCPKGPKLKAGPYKGQPSGHHWIIGSPAGKTSAGKCRRCGEERNFSNSTVDNTWRGYTSGTEQRARTAAATEASRKKAEETRKRTGRSAGDRYYTRYSRRRPKKGDA